ncbi:MAG: response regulator [Limisphaerales bacterium]
MKSALPPILMVDDEPNMRSTVSELLMDDGYTVDLAESGEQAVEMLNEPGNEYFMMITDGRLGGMSGYELLKKAKDGFPKMRGDHDHRFCDAQARRGSYSERRGRLSL